MGTKKPEGRDALLARLATYVEPGSAEGHPIHRLHPYPAKYIPRLPREVLVEHTNERNTVLDPFCGSGTTLVEAALLGRKSVGVDSNPIAALVSAAKTTALSDEQLTILTGLASEIRGKGIEPSAKAKSTLRFENAEHWFQPNMARELVWIRSRVRAVGDPDARRFAECVLSSIVTACSNQDSDTRYKAVEKNLSDGYAIGRFIRRLDEGIIWISDFSSDPRARKNRPRVLNEDVATLSAEMLPDNSIDLVVTSPPYPNSYDYYLYHKLRMLVLGLDFKEAQRQEIGSRYEHSSRKAPIDTFIARMRPVMSNVARTLKPSKLAYLFVGDSVLAGRHIDMSELYRDLGEGAGLALIGETEYGLDLVSRSFADTRSAAGGAHQHRKLQRVLVFESTRVPSGRAAAPNRSRAKMVGGSAPLSLSERSPDNGSVVVVASDDRNRHVHSIGHYPSKFVPELPRWAIEAFSSPGDRVLDPFGGSGTTAVEAVIAGRNVVSADISPYSTLLTKGKLVRTGEASLLRAVDHLTGAVERGRFSRSERLEFPLDDFWFDVKDLAEFEGIRQLIRQDAPPRLRPFFEATLATTVRGFSYQDPGQIKVKRDPKKVLHGTPTPAELFVKRLPAFAERLVTFNDRCVGRASSTVRTVSADRVGEGLDEGSFDLIVTSPPYINAMNYAMTQRYELLLMGLVPESEMKAHQSAYFGTERVYSRDYSIPRTVPQSWSAAADLNPRLAAIFKAEPKRSFIAWAFFAGMHSALQDLMRLLRPEGRLVLITGTNVIRNVPIDTFEVLMTMGEDLGARRELVFHYEIIKQAFKLTRHKTANVIPHDGVGVLVAP